MRRKAKIMKTRVIYLMAFCMLLLSSNAFATNWVEVPGSNGITFVDADSAVKQGGSLIFWCMTLTPQNQGTRNNVLVRKMAEKFEVDLRTPRNARRLLTVVWDINDRQIGAPWPPDALNCNWFSASAWPAIDVALPYAKEGQDAGAIPAPVSSRY